MERLTSSSFSLLLVLRTHSTHPTLVPVLLFPNSPADTLHAGLTQLTSNSSLFSLQATAAFVLSLTTLNHTHLSRDGKESRTSVSDDMEYEEDSEKGSDLNRAGCISDRDANSPPSCWMLPVPANHAV
ncbi:hypothetical protein BLNAU_1951 [Blattamonas nauphoetae]|uniref:Uncharacterized protein n=1 Tax=Blattamonas nauphoetae TaxID=2049346 RepID=A0ABQ9YGN9_9EUKA|nr:hypothetical protein BLNAU_24133 [Blattamonas nauphoetae]KAK2962928.1 hypothetical protein BLNAU_1951 [Blattamonas nauphoetae]